MTTRKTYDLPAPTTNNDKWSTWPTGYSIEIDGDPDNNGTVTHYRKPKIITVDTHEGEELTLNYDEAERVALTLLAAVEEANTQQENH